jgi:ornithine decarboxylase
LTLNPGAPNKRAHFLGFAFMNVQPTPVPRASQALSRYASFASLIEKTRPALPWYALHPARFRKAASRFLSHFCGTTMYAVKANPVPHVLDQIYESGIRHFDTASLAEIELIRGRYPDSTCHFMAPVRIPGEAGTAWRQHGLTDFVVDCDPELDKLLAETDGGKALRIFVRVATPLGGAMLELSSKFGTSPPNAARLLKRIAGAGATPAITFHVGSQCLSPFSYAQAVELARRAAEMSGVPIRALDVGGGFPGPYPGNDVPPYHWYFDTVREAITTFPLVEGGEVLCEPGRALCAEGVSLVTRVILRRDDQLFLNDGIYGSFDELAVPAWTADYPRRVFGFGPSGRVRERRGELKPFKIFGPTCDTLDVLPRPLLLPQTVQQDDYIVFETMGAYSVALRTGFNGFYPNDWAIIDGE